MAAMKPDDFCIDNGARFEVGEQWRDHGLCNLKICEPGGFISHKTCPVLEVPTGCFRMEGNLNVEFPHCCPTAECPWGAGDSMSSSSSSSSSDEEDDLFDEDNDEGGMEVMKGPELEPIKRSNASDDDNVEVKSHFEQRNSHRMDLKTREYVKGNKNIGNTNVGTKVDWRNMCKEDEDNQLKLKSTRDSLQNKQINSDDESVGDNRNERKTNGGYAIHTEPDSFKGPAQDVENVIRNLKSERVQNVFRHAEDRGKVDYFEGMDDMDMPNAVERSEDGTYLGDLGPDLEFESVLKKVASVKDFLDREINENVDNHGPLIEDLKQVQNDREQEEKEEKFLKLLGPDKKFEKVLENVKNYHEMSRIMEEASGNLPKEYMPTLHDEMDEIKRFHTEEYEIMYGAGEGGNKYELRSDEKDNSSKTISSGGVMAGVPVNPEDRLDFLNRVDEEELRKLKIEFNNEMSDIVSQKPEPSWIPGDYVDEGNNEQVIRNEGDTGNENKHLGDRDHSVGDPPKENTEETQDINHETSYQNKIEENCPGHPDAIDPPEGEGGPVNQVLAAEEDNLPYDILDDNEYLQMADTRILPDQVEYLNERYQGDGAAEGSGTDPVSRVPGLEDTHQDSITLQQDNTQLQSDSHYIEELLPKLEDPEWHTPTAEPLGLYEDDDNEKSNGTYQDTSTTTEDTEISQNTNEESGLY